MAYTIQNLKLSLEDFYSKCEKIHNRFVHIYKVNKFLTENFKLCAVWIRNYTGCYPCITPYIPVFSPNAIIYWLNEILFFLRFYLFVCIQRSKLFSVQNSVQSAILDTGHSNSNKTTAQWHMILFLQRKTLKNFDCLLITHDDITWKKSNWISS